MASETKRVNITINEAAHSRLREIVDTLYGGNFSRFVSDAAIFYAGALSNAGRESVESYVAARQAVCSIPRILYERGSQVSVLLCNYCGHPNPHQVNSLSADTVNVLCPGCGNEQIIKGFRPSTTWIPLEAAARAFCGYYSGERAGALDPQAIQLVKWHFGHRKIDHLSEEEWAEALTLLERERQQLNEMRSNLKRAGEKEE